MPIRLGFFISTAREKTNSGEGIKVKLYFLIALMFLGVAAKADLIGQQSSPYKMYQNLSDEGKARLASDFFLMAPSMIDVKDQKQVDAFLALVTEYPTISGDEVLENLDQNIINWFYGVSEDQVQENLLHKVGVISRTPNESDCMRHTICVVVSVPKQRVYAYYNGSPISGVHNTGVSTARRGKSTPRGYFTVNEIAGAGRRSGLYNGAPMPYAMQFWGNYFLHGTYEKITGTPASAGCVRMHVSAAKKLNGLMRQVNKNNIRVVVK